MAEEYVCPGCGDVFDGTHGLSIHASRWCEDISEEGKQAVNGMNTGQNHPSYGHTMSEESKQELRKMRLGENNPMHGKTGEENPMYGKEMSDEAIEKSVENMPDMSGSNNPNYKHGKYLKRHCKECGELYQPSIQNQKYCTMSCMADAFRTNQNGKFCEYCNDFYVPNNQNQRYCSVRCSNKAGARNKDMPAFYWAIRQLIGKQSWYEVRKNNTADECYKCGSETKLHLHHIVPVMAGGTNDDWNLMTLCESCHKIVENKTQDIVDRHLDVMG